MHEVVAVVLGDLEGLRFDAFVETLRKIAFIKEGDGRELGIKNKKYSLTGHGKYESFFDWTQEIRNNLKLDTIFFNTGREQWL